MITEEGQNGLRKKQSQIETANEKQEKKRSKNSGDRGYMKKLETDDNGQR